MALTKDSGKKTIVFIKRILPFVLVFLLGMDLLYSLVQHFYMPLENDMVQGILQKSTGWRMLEDPLGLKALFKHEVYPEPNRFMVPISMSVYFKNVPLFLQYFVSPINSIYLSCAIFKIVVQGMLICLLSMAITGFRRLFSKEFWVAAILIAPLFQTCGFIGTMGIIDQSISYTFFYALPLGLLLLYFLPFYKDFVYSGTVKLNILIHILLVIMAILLAFSGPLISPVVIIVCSTYIIHRWWNFYKLSPQLSFFKRTVSSFNKIPRFFLIHFTIFTLLCMYSLYIGVIHSNFSSYDVSLLERYLRLPRGIYGELTQQAGLPVLLGLIVLNIIIIRKSFYNTEGKRILTLLKWIVIFAAIYIAFLPMGGYRPYRPNILRYDTFMPVTLLLLFIYGTSTLFIIRKFTAIAKTIYVSVVVAFLVWFTVADKPNIRGNSCEKHALETIAASPDKIVLLNTNCTVISWGIITDYHESELKGEMLLLWHVTKEKKLYYQK